MDLLLNHIQQITSSAYMSDLRRIILDNRAKDVISQIPENQYSLCEWNEAAGYIRNKVCDYETIEEAKKCILNNGSELK